MKKYKFTILATIVWVIWAQFVLYASLNHWVMNAWVQVNFYGIAVLGWAIAFSIYMYEDYK